MAVSIPACLFARTSELVAIAQDNSVGLYHASTLKKLRVEPISDYRITGLFLKGKMLHVVDTKKNYYSYDTDQHIVIETRQLALSSGGGVVAASEEGASRPTVQVGRQKRLAANKDTSTVEVLQAFFHVAPANTMDGAFRKGDVCVAVLTSLGVYHLNTSSDEQLSRLVIPFPQGLSASDASISVGHRTGIVVMFQRNQKWLWWTNVFPQSGKHTVPKQQLLQIGAASVACQPDGHGVAVGGARGELAYYPDITSSTQSHFSDHWHHTPLTALSFSVDGQALYTGAAESMLLLWNLSNFSHRKLGCSLGTIFSITTSVDTPSRLLLTCGESTIADVDLGVHKVVKSLDGIHWSSTHPCTGLVAVPWMGQRCVALTGLPDTVRICDPVSQQAVHSLHVSYQMETIVAPPSVGITQLAVLDDGKVIVTYEKAEAFVLPAALRFWSYDPVSRKHVEEQCVFTPHRNAIIGIAADEEGKRIFTLSSDSVKCWAQTESKVGKSSVHEKPKQWRNIGMMETECPAKTSCLALSPDGSVCFVADDAVHAYDVLEVEAGQPWLKLKSFYQTTTTEPLRRMVYAPAAQAVVACGANGVFAWSLASEQSTDVAVFEAPDTVVGVTLFTEKTILAATGDGLLCEVDIATGEEVGQCATHKGIQFMECLRPGTARVALVVEGSGYCMVNVHCTKKEQAKGRGGAASSSSAAATSEVSFNEQLEEAAQADALAAYHATPLSSYFRVKQSSGEVDGDGRPIDEEEEGGGVGGREHALAVNSTRRWLHSVVGGEAYSAPPVTSFLSAFVDALQGK